MSLKWHGHVQLEIMCDQCNLLRSLREIQETVLPEVRKQSYCWPVACDYLQAADDGRVSQILFEYQGHMPKDEYGWPTFLTTLNQLARISTRTS